jgi:hypothetical protein
MTTPARITRLTLDFARHPDLVVIYLGMGAKSLRGIMTMIKLRPQIARSVAAKPDGLLAHEDLFFSLLPLHLGMRQYWHDLDCVERWTRELPHQGWWRDFLRDPRGTYFWHETYCCKGGFEAIYDGLDHPFGALKFGAAEPARGRMFSARTRIDPAGSAPAAPVPEHELN